jgi:hypothetical protein
MGRPPIGKKAMTDAERQKRRRKKLAAEASAEVQKFRKAQKRAQAAKGIFPAPPGISYWRFIDIEPGVRTTISQPTTLPFAQCELDLEPDDLLALIGQLAGRARQLGIEAEALQAFRDGPRPGLGKAGLMVPEDLAQAGPDQVTYDLLSGKRTTGL